MIIKDETMGTSRYFPTSKEGYADALAYIKSIVGQGHVAGGDVYKVYSFFGIH